MNVVLLLYKILKIVASSTLIVGLTANYSLAQSGSLNLLANCANVGDGYINISGSDLCLRLGGEIRSRFHIGSKRNMVQDYPIDVRGQMTIDARKQSESKTVHTHIKFSGESNNGLKFEEGFAQYGSIYAGLAQSFGNLTYGEFAHEPNYNLYHADNISPLFGYSRDFFDLFNIGISLERVTSISPYNTWDMGYRGELFGDWGKIGYASGNQIHHFEKAMVDKEHPAYINLTNEEKEDVGDPRDLGVIAFYVGIGGELNLPFIPTTKIGLNGFYINGTLAKLGIPRINLSQRIPDGKDAGRPMDKNQIAITREAYSNSEPVMMERFKDFLVIPSEDETDEAYIRELKVSNGFSVNGGISHAFNSQFEFHLNNGFYSVTDHDYHANGTMIGTSLDFKPYAGLTLSIGGEFLNTAVTYQGSNEAIRTEFEYDQEGNIEPAYSVTLSAIQAF